METKGYITASDLFSLLAARDKIIILDIRRKQAYDEYHLSGAVHIDADGALDYLEGASESTEIPVIVVSDLEEPSSSLSADITGKGYNSFYLKGGMEEGWFKLVRHIRIHEQK